MRAPALHHYDIVLELDDADSAVSRESRHLVQRATAQVLRRRGRSPARARA